MTEAEDVAAQARAQEITAELEALVTKLQELHDGIPVTPLEPVMLVGEADMDFATALRSTIECLLADRLKPALVELRKWAAYRPPGKERK